jgi:hypothetical protein
MAVSTGVIVEHFNAIVDLGIGDIPRLVDLLHDPFLLQTAQGRFVHCLIPAVARLGHTGLKMMHKAESLPSSLPNFEL